LRSFVATCAGSNKQASLLGLLILLAAATDFGAGDMLLAVRLEGLRHTDPARVRLEIEADSGRICGDSCQREDLDRLEHLGVFAQTEALRRGDTLVYRFKELPWFLPVPNGRITDEEGLSVGAGIKTPNLLGEAIAGEFLFLAGSDFEWEASASSERLAKLPLAWDAVTSRTQRWDDGRGYNEVSYHSSLTLQGPSDGPLRLLGAASVVDVHADREGIALSSDRQDWIPSLRGGLVWDDRDHLGLTTRGIYQELSLEKAGRPLGGPVDAWEMLCDTRLWIPLGDAWGLHASHLLQRQWGTVGGWRTYVVGGINTARGLPAAWDVAPSEELATLELRWLFLPVRTQTVLGQSFFWGLQAVAGADYAATWDVEGSSRRRGESLLGGIDLIVPFVERVRTTVSWNPGPKGGWGFSVGLFEKTTVQRYRVR
jgi:outer membrane protein assembly factor BamA